MGLLKILFPLGFLIWSFFQPQIASYVFSSIAAGLLIYLYFTDITLRPSRGEVSFRWTCEETEIIRKYYLALRWPLGARVFSNLLNGIRLSTIIWVPWLLWNKVWIPASFLALYFFISASISVRLDPFFFLNNAVSKGMNQYHRELLLLRHVFERLQGSHEGIGIWDTNSNG